MSINKASETAKVKRLAAAAAAEQIIYVLALKTSAAPHRRLLVQKTSAAPHRHLLVLSVQAKGLERPRRFRGARPPGTAWLSRSMSATWTKDQVQGFEGQLN